MAVRRSKVESEDGIAAVDALIALMILSTTIALSLQVVDTARRVAAQAAETRRADVQLRVLSDTTMATAGYQVGSSDRFSWRISVIPSGGGGEPALRTCAKIVELQSSTSGRTYRVATSAPCPPTGTNP